MSMMLNRDGYQQLIDGDLQWLDKQPKTLEREHIAAVLKESPARIYEPPRPPTQPDTKGMKCLNCQPRCSFCAYPNAIELLREARDWLSKDAGNDFELRDRIDAFLAKAT